MGSLNLCLKKSDSLQKESAQSDHPTQRKRAKCGPILLFQANVKISEYLCTFWTFSLCKRVGWSFLIHKFRLPTTYYSKNFEIPFFMVEGPLQIFVDEDNLFPDVFLYIGYHIR